MSTIQASQPEADPGCIDIEGCRMSVACASRVRARLASRATWTEEIGSTTPKRCSMSTWVATAPKPLDNVRSKSRPPPGSDHSVSTHTGHPITPAGAQPRPLHRARSRVDAQRRVRTQPCFSFCDAAYVHGFLFRTVPDSSGNSPPRPLPPDPVPEPRPQHDPTAGHRGLTQPGVGTRHDFSF